jgi:hypothetical protein
MVATTSTFPVGGNQRTWGVCGTKNTAHVKQMDINRNNSSQTEVTDFDEK